MLLLIAFQVLMLNHLQISGYGTPIIIACMILYMPLPDPVNCPCCGDEADTFFLQDGIVIGCNHCVIEVDADPAYLD